MTDGTIEKRMTRDEIRNKIFGTDANKRVSVTLFGATFEIKQPTVAEIMDQQSEPDAKKRAANTMINYCFITGTDERVFDEADVESILALPYNKEFNTLQSEVNKLIGVGVDEEEDASKK